MEEEVSENFIIDLPDGLKLNGIIDYPSLAGAWPMIIIMHGFKAYMDWGFFPYISKNLAQNCGFAIRFNFSLNGISDTGNEIYDLALFSKNNISHELDDARLVIEYFKVRLAGENLENEAKWDGRIFLLGHSMGGAISILTASMRDDISRVAAWSTISRFDRYTRRQKQEWKDKGYMGFINNQTGQELRIDYSYVEDLESNAEKYSLIKAVNKLKIPFLIVHGDNDLTVPLSEGKALARAARKEELRFEIIKNTGHIYNIETPFRQSTKALEAVMDLTISFFNDK